MSFLKRIISYMAPFYDSRVLVLVCACLGVELLVDPAATLGLAGYLAYIIGMAGVALLVSKMLMPYLSTSDCARSALQDGNVAAALIVLSRAILTVMILVCLMAWGK